MAQWSVLPTPGTDEDVDVLDIHLSCRLSVKSIRGQPVDDRFRTHACERPHTRWVVPLISGHQRPAAAGDFRPRIIYGQGQDTRAHSNWPGPGPPRTTNKVTGRIVECSLAGLRRVWVDWPRQPQ